MEWNLNLKTTELNKPIYRIISFDRFYATVVKKKNKLNSPSSWDDPFENLIKNVRIIKNNRQNSRLATCDSAYAQCWSFSNENDLLWRVYSKTGDGLRIRSTPLKLINSILNSNQYKQILSDPEHVGVDPDNDQIFEEIGCYIGKVEYKSMTAIKKYIQNLARDSSFSTQIKTLLIKREPFRDEKELRLIVWHFTGVLFDFDWPFIYDFDVNESFDEIVFDPRISEPKFNGFSNVLRTAGYENNILKSDIYDTPELINIPPIENESSTVEIV